MPIIMVVIMIIVSALVVWIALAIPEQRSE